MVHVELGIKERRRIERAMNAGIPVAQIARGLGRHRSTVYRQIARNGFIDEEIPYPNGYDSSVAQIIAGREGSDVATWCASRCFRPRSSIGCEPEGVLNRSQAGFARMAAGRISATG